MLEPVVPDVAERMAGTPLDYGTLAQFLQAMAYPARLELLDTLRVPQTLSEIRLTARRGAIGRPDRPAAKQTVQAHLDKLVDADLVRVEEVARDGRQIPRYVVNPPKVYAFLEELRRISVVYAGVGFAADATGTLSSTARPADAAGPRLVLVHGVYEGKSYTLTPSTASDDGWTVGRARECPISLDYDPYVSVAHARITRAHAHPDSGFVITDLPESKNGTAINWRFLEPGGSRILRPGDVIGVGRSLLSFIPQ